MNENLNLVQIIKDCPKGIKLYSTICDEVQFEGIVQDSIFPIKTNEGGYCIDGRYFEDKGECTLFPSKDQRDWSKFKAPIPDKALVWCSDECSPYYRELRFYDAKNKNTFTRGEGLRNGGSFNNYELYQGEYPEWAKKAQKELED